VKDSDLAMVYELWQESFEWTYYDEVLAGMEKTSHQTHSNTTASFQALFCIDDRECSIRRYAEELDKNCKTFGTPGHFNIVTHFQPENSAFHTQICPAPLTPKHLIKELESGVKSKKDYHFTNHDHSQQLVYGLDLSFSLISSNQVLQLVQFLLSNTWTKKEN
jgi:uncharacterized protein YbcC (UPF0753/DUF2309 family)